jgi:hypothetical protein
MPFTIASKNLGINLTKEVKVLYNENYKYWRKRFKKIVEEGWGMAQVEERLPSKWKFLSSKPQYYHKKKRLGVGKTCHGLEELIL